MKEAVAFVVDTSKSMNQSFAGGLTTKLELAKSIVSSITGKLWIQSTENKVCVVVLKTEGTSNHKVAEGQADFQNISEIPPTGMGFPDVEMIRKIDQIRSFENDKLRGDFCDGIFLASESLWAETAKKKFRRRIIVLTDAGHKVKMNAGWMTTAISGCKDMECPIDVVAFDFESFDQTKVEDESDGSDAETEASESSEENESGFTTYREKSDCEQILLDFVEKTEGRVIPFTSLDEVVSELGKGEDRGATLFQMDFSIAPGIDISARFYKMMSPEESGKLKTGSIQPDGSIAPTTTVTKYLDPDDPDEQFEAEDTTEAIRYGSHYEVINKEDEKGLKPMFLYKPRVAIVTYVPKTAIGPNCMIGSPYAVTGHDSKKACTVLESFSSALAKSDKTAIAFLWKRKSSRPCLAAVFPADSSNRKYGQLIIFEIPYAGTLKDLRDIISDDDLATIHSELSHEQESLVSDLISSMSLEREQVNPSTTPSPFLKGWQSTIVAKAKDEQNAIVPGRGAEAIDPLRTPTQVQERVSEVADNLRKSFDLKKLMEIDK